MFMHRRITLACAVAAMAVAPSSALAMPATDPPPSTEPSSAPIVREVETSGGDTTLALVLSGSALLIAAGAAAVSGHDHRRLGKVA
jgi:CubicO group peptidase (beta-lactamase class C family)